jgi:pimeloyl-ACP methyl ester carboxylesterase
MGSKRTAFSAMVAFCASVGWLASKSDSALSVTALAEKPVIVLVHGAFIDATSFQGLIPLLQERHYRVIAVQNPLTSFDDDVATTRRLLQAQHGPIVLVGHSYGGAVISAAGAGNSNVKALVYIAAFAPDAGEPIGGLQSRYAPPLLSNALVPDAAGFLYVDTAKFHDVVAQDLPVRLTRVAAVTQKPLINTVFTASSPQAAWRTIPSWYLIATEDHAINPDLERFYAKRMNAHTTEVRSSHVMYISHPADVAKVIEAAATAAAGQPTATNR